MKDETRYLLDGLLADWHQWARGWQHVSGHEASAMFTGVRSSRQWDAENEVTEASLHSSQMQAVDFCVGELEPLHRTAIGINARNLCTGRSVWTSARLPTDLQERAELLATARNLLLDKLRAAGVM